MKEVDINHYIQHDEYTSYLLQVPNDVKLVGKCDELYIFGSMYTESNKLDLSSVNCTNIIYIYPFNLYLHKLPNNLTYLSLYDGDMEIYPDLPKSVINLYIHNVNMKNLSWLPKHIKLLRFYSENEIDYIPYNMNLRLYEGHHNLIKISNFNIKITNNKELKEYMEILFYKTKKSARN